MKRDPRPAIRNSPRRHCLLDVRERLAAVGVEVDYRPAAEFAPYPKQQKAGFADIIRTSNISIE